MNTNVKELTHPTQGLRNCPGCGTTEVLPHGHGPGCAHTGKDIDEIIPRMNTTDQNRDATGAAGARIL